MSDLMLKGKNEQDSKVANKVAAKTENVEITPMLGKRPLMRETAVDFNTITPSQIAHLQRTVGNQAIRRAVQRMGIQRKMTVGPVGDKYEQEADAVAKQVVQNINAPQPIQRQEEDEELQMMPLPSISTLQRQEEEELQMKPQFHLPPLPTISTLQRQEDEEELQMKPMFASLLQRQEEEELQMKPTAVGVEGGALSSSLEQKIQSARGGGRPLAAPVRGSMEQAFGSDFSSVRVHTSGQSDRLNRSIQARAFTTGQDIFFRSGEYNPVSTAGQKLLAHELTHTVQQSASTIHRQKAKNKPAIQASPTAFIQRADAETMGGEWDYKKYDLFSSGTRRGVETELEFEPNDKVNATKIGLVQTVNSIKNDNPYVINNNQTIKDRSLDNTTGQYEGKSDKGFHVDRLSSKNNPVYGTESGVDLESSTFSVGKATKNSLGWNYTDVNNTVKNQKAKLRDFPKLNNANINSGNYFETTALAIEGEQKGTYYGSVKWGWETDGA